MKKLISTTILCLAIIAGSFAQYGGNITLRFTFEGLPMVGYTITGSINKVDIGGSGVTDRNGEVRLRTDPLPTPAIDVKGTRSCGNNSSEFSVAVVL